MSDEYLYCINCGEKCATTCQKCSIGTIVKLQAENKELEKQLCIRTSALKVSEEVVSAAMVKIEKLQARIDNMSIAVRSCEAELSQAKKANNELNERLDDLIEDIETPSRLGLDKPVNPNWIALNRAREYQRKYKGE